jgi:ferredoxin
MRVFIDPERCRGHALCLSYAPDAFEFIDLEDRATVREGADVLALKEQIMEAARECPERAIMVQLEQGE